MNSRTTLSLPALSHESNQWRLPLCDATAMTLASATADVAENISSRLTTALAIDPTLAIWTLWQTTRESAKREQSDSPHSIASLAQWFAPRLLHLLDWQTAAPAMEVSADQHGRYAALVAESVAAAHHAVRSLGREDFNFEPAYLAALTSQWPQWLSCLAIRQSARQSTTARMAVARTASSYDRLNRGSHSR